MIDLEKEAIDRTSKDLQKQEDKRILFYLKVATERAKIEQYDSIRAIYVGALKYGWRMIASRFKNEYAVTLTPMDDPVTVIVTKLRPREK